MEEYRRQIIERERQKMLKEHASKLLGFLPKVGVSSSKCMDLLIFFLFYLNLPNTPQKNPSRFLLNQERRLQLNAFASSVNTGHPTPSSLTRFSVSLASLPPSFPPNYHLTCACSYGCLCVFSWGFIKGLAPGKLTGRARFCPPGLRDRF